MRLGPLLFLILSFALVSAAQGSDEISTLARSKRWLRLLHFKRSYSILSLGALKSEVEQGDFFFAPNGRWDPEAELRADVAVFTNPNLERVGRLKLHPQCAFPARYRFLKAELRWDVQDVACPELDAFMKKISGDQLSLVFSSAYPNSPPSMFGHTLIRVHANGRSDLLDYGINYSALTDENADAISFAVLGLAGGYAGQFGIVPYYMKVNEYNHAESRDLWEYDLSLTAEEMRVFFWHLWELDQTATFHYYFFDENCSYRLLTLLEVAKPEWDLSQFAAGVFPAETIKRVVGTPGAVTGVHHRLSLRARMNRQFDGLDSSQRSSALEVAKGGGDTKSVRDPAVLEAAISYLQFRRLKGLNHLEEPDQTRFIAALTQRASLGAQSVEELTSDASPDENRPDHGHSPYLVSAGGGAFRQNGTSAGYGQLHFKSAYHDLLNDDQGYLPFSEVDFPELTLRYSPDLHSLWVEQLRLISATSLFPMSDLEKQFSWKVDFSYITPKDLACVNCHAAMAEGGVGAAKSFLSDRVLFYGLGMLHFEAGSAIQNGIRFTPKILTAALVHPVSSYKTQLAASATADVWQSVRRSHYYELEWTHSLSLSRNWEVRATGSTIFSEYRDFALSLNRYF